VSTYLTLSGAPGQLPNQEKNPAKHHLSPPPPPLPEHLQTNPTKTKQHLNNCRSSKPTQPEPSPEQRTTTRNVNGATTTQIPQPSPESCKSKTPPNSQQHRRQTARDPQNPKHKNKKPKHRNKQQQRTGTEKHLTKRLEHIAGKNTPSVHIAENEQPSNNGKTETTRTKTPDLAGTKADATKQKKDQHITTRSKNENQQNSPEQRNTTGGKTN
jgi:hypothetical protein